MSEPSGEGKTHEGAGAHDGHIDRTIVAIRQHPRDPASWWVGVAHDLADEVERLRGELAAALRLPRPISAAASRNDASRVGRSGRRETRSGEL
jgi:hypothetical protein